MISIWILFCVPTNLPFCQKNELSFNLFSLWNHSLIIVCINTVWAKADSPNSRSYTVFTGKGHLSPSRQPSCEIWNSIHTVCLFTSVNILFNSSETKTPSGYRDTAILGKARFTFLRKRKPSWVQHLHLPALLALAGRIQWDSSQLWAAASLEESAPTEGFSEKKQGHPPLQQHGGCSHSWWGKCLFFFFLSHTPLKCKPESYGAQFTSTNPVGSSRVGPQRHSKC